ncbi:MAG: hypothetical protein CMJ74_04410 [Planctomycetaceae bacterium]|nr:hypothetical protein [Planctomycetaceae bacterium]
MICCISAGDGKIQWLSDVHPDYRDAGITAQGLIGDSIWDYIVENKADIRRACGCDLPAGETIQPTSVGCVVTIKNISSRWILSVEQVESSDGSNRQIIIIATSIPFNLPDLTPRERDVFGLLSHGFTSAGIGEKLGISASTVDKHRVKIKSALELSHEYELQIAARQVENPDGIFFRTEKVSDS